MYAALRAKEEIALTVRSFVTLGIANSPLSGAVWVAAITATAALQPPLPSAHRPALAGRCCVFRCTPNTASPDPPACPAKPYGELLANSAQALLLLRKPADPDGSWFSVASSKPSAARAVFLRRPPCGLPCGAMDALSLCSAESRGGSFLTRPLLPCSHRHRSRWSRWRWQARKPA